MPIDRKIVDEYLYVLNKKFSDEFNKVEVQKIFQQYRELTKGYVTDVDHVGAIIGQISTIHPIAGFLAATASYAKMWQEGVRNQKIEAEFIRLTTRVSQILQTMENEVNGDVNKITALLAFLDQFNYDSRGIPETTLRQMDRVQAKIRDFRASITQQEIINELFNLRDELRLANEQAKNYRDAIKDGKRDGYIKFENHVLIIESGQGGTLPQVNEEAINRLIESLDNIGVRNMRFNNLLRTSSGIYNATAKLVDYFKARNSGIQDRAYQQQIHQDLVSSGVFVSEIGKAIHSKGLTQFGWAMQASANLYTAALQVAAIKSLSLAAVNPIFGLINAGMTLFGAIMGGSANDSGMMQSLYDALSERIDALAQHIDARFDRLENLQISHHQATLKALQAIHDELLSVSVRTALIGARVDQIEKMISDATKLLYLSNLHAHVQAIDTAINASNLVHMTLADRNQWMAELHNSATTKCNENFVNGNARFMQNFENRISILEEASFNSSAYLALLKTFARELEAPPTGLMMIASHIFPQPHRTIVNPYIWYIAASHFITLEFHSLTLNFNRYAAQSNHDEIVVFGQYYLDAYVSLTNIDILKAILNKILNSITQLNNLQEEVLARMNQPFKHKYRLDFYANYTALVESARGKFPLNTQAGGHVRQYKQEKWIATPQFFQQTYTQYSIHWHPGLEARAKALYGGAAGKAHLDDFTTWSAIEEYHGDEIFPGIMHLAGLMDLGNLKMAMHFYGTTCLDMKKKHEYYHGVEVVFDLKEKSPTKILDLAAVDTTAPDKEKQKKLIKKQKALSEDIVSLVAALDKKISEIFIKARNEYIAEITKQTATLHIELKYYYLLLEKVLDLIGFDLSDHAVASRETEIWHPNLIYKKLSTEMPTTRLFLPTEQEIKTLEQGIEQHLQNGCMEPRINHEIRTTLNRFSLYKNYTPPAAPTDNTSVVLGVVAAASIVGFALSRGSK